MLTVEGNNKTFNHEMNSVYLVIKRFSALWGRSEVNVVRIESVRYRCGRLLNFGL